MQRCFSVTRVLLLVVVSLALADNAYAECGYKACPPLKPNMINVHLVPHSHDDVGWLKTVDQYYYGSKNRIQHAGVQYILDSVVNELLKDKNRRFIYVESAFFFKWYLEQSKYVQQQVQKLVNEGRLVFAGGAWSMNDEGAVHYQSVIDQFSMGLKALSDTFGSCGRPTVGWQIDPFGHSREQASLFAHMGFSGEFFARVDWVEKAARFKNLDAEMIWKASSDLGEKSELFTGILWNHYSAPPGFCFDVLCNDQPIIEGSGYENNVEERVSTFISYINNMTKVHRSSNLLVPMGDDFNYENAALNFKNMDKLIKHVNNKQRFGSKVHLFYSTPECYLIALHKERSLTWPVKTQDFFPYSSDWHSYWTGYYSSRPTQKRFERLGNHFLQVTKQLTTFAKLTDSKANENLNELRHAMGIMQHHDAITGTEKQHVAYDYDRILTDALNAAQLNARRALQNLTKLKNAEFFSCLQLNISVCEFTQRFRNGSIIVTVFNPLGHKSVQYVRIPVISGVYSVTNAGQEIPSQLVPLPREIVALSFRPDSTKHELVFKASVSKLSHYFVKLIRLTNDQYPPPKVGNNIYITAPCCTTLHFNDNGRLDTIGRKEITTKVSQEFFYYRAAAGNNMEFKNRSSGAYVFRPNGSEVLINDRATLVVIQGPLLTEVHQHINNWISQVIRLYNGTDRVEFEWLVGPIPVEDKIGKEVITRFKSSIESNGAFWTDSNGREMMLRNRNKREYFQPNMTEHVSGNYYPITTRIAIEDQRTRLALLNDRAQGGTSRSSGELELMLHRRLLRDDAFGVGESLNETAFGKGLIARGKLYLMLDPKKTSQTTVAERNAQKEIHLPFWTFFSNSKENPDKNQQNNLIDFNLPTSIELLTLEPYSEREILLRLEHYLDRKEATSVKFNIYWIFKSLGGRKIRETTLDGSMPLDEMKRLKFTPDDGKIPEKREFYTANYTPLQAKEGNDLHKFDVVFQPMQIRTFIISS